MNDNFIPILPPFKPILNKTLPNNEILGGLELITNPYPLLNTYKTADGKFLASIEGEPTPLIEVVSSLKRTFLCSVLECRKVERVIDLVVDLNGSTYKGYSLITLPLTVMFIGNHTSYDISSRKLEVAHPFSTITDAQIEAWKRILSFVKHYATTNFI